LRVAEVLPAPNATEIAGDAMLTVIFNRPVLPLGTVSDPVDAPHPLRFSPEVEGQGEWLNTSIYTFQPADVWAGGTEYTVTVEAGLEAVDGAVLSEDYSWSFETDTPRVVEVNPEDGTGAIRLDARIQARFNTSADRASLEEHFYMRPAEDESGTVSGTFEWPEDDSKGFSFRPDELLELDTVYVVGFPADSVFDASGQSAFEATSWQLATVPYPAVVGTDPMDGAEDVGPYISVALFFASEMDTTDAKEKLVIDPEPWRAPDLFFGTHDNALRMTFPVEPSTEYTITLEPGLADRYGNTIDTAFTFGFTTAPYPPDVSLQVPGPVGLYNAYREETQLFLVHRNVSELDLSLYNVPLERFAERVAGDDYYDPAYDYFPAAEDLLRRWQIESVAPLNARRYELLDLGGETGTTVICPGALEPRVKVGDTAIVVTDPDPLRARSQPVDGEVVASLYRDYVIPVVGGPVCADGVLWWQVRLRDDRDAWVAEGLDDEYFIDVRIARQTTAVVIPEEFSEGEGLRPGVYLLEVHSPETVQAGYRPQKHFLLVATANLTVKMARDAVTVWATDVQTGAPIAGAPITVYGENFTVAASGTTDEDGIMTVDIPPVPDLNVARLAVLQDGEHYGLGLSGWSDGIDPWRFNLPSSYYPQRYSLYLHTDRSVYRPDQPVYFRGVVRAKDDVTYTLPELDSVPVQIYDDQNEVIYRRELPLTEFGTFSDTFDLAEDAPLGFYRINVELPREREYQWEGGSINFSVAEYRLPEFEVDVIPVEGEVAQGDTIEVEVEARYFFGGMVSNATAEYNVIANPYYFDYAGPGPRYEFADFDYDAGPGAFFNGGSGIIASGTGTTDAGGLLTIEVPADLRDAIRSQVFTIEVTIRDESDQTVAGRAEVVVHQGEIYLGIRPEEYVGTALSDTFLHFLAVDWDSEPVAGQEIDIEIVERRWSSVQEEGPDGRTIWTWEVEEIPVTTADVVTGDDGRASYIFIPPNGGIFKIIATSRDRAGNEVRSSTTMWISSREYVSWRQQNSNRIDLITDRSEYDIGDTAEVLIMSPFQGEVEALVTVERGHVLHAERITLDTNSYVYQLPIEADYAPNVYVSVVLVKGVDEDNPIAAFRMGLAQLQVDNSRKEITLEITPDIEQAGPRDTVTYTIHATDYQGEPVQAEIGVGLTDLAALSIGEPNSGPLLSFFYGPQDLSVRTALALSMNTDLITQTVLDTIKGGGGGFGEAGIFDIREEFVDTAYWNAALVTGEDGTASFKVTLPDNLTTWRLDARAVTRGDDGLTLVGQDTFDLLSTRPLLIRPVTPRFFVVDDELSLVAVVNNNTGEAQSVEVALEGTGLDFQGDSVQTLVIPAGGRARASWPVVVQDVESVDLTFFVRSEDGEYTDASRPPLGRGDDRLLPVYRYEAPEIVGTGGVLREGGAITEGIALPRRFEVTQGELTVNLEPSLAAASLEGLEALRDYPYLHIEAVISRFLPNIMMFRALESLGITDEALESELNLEVQLAIQRLHGQQKVDGGWGWFVQDESNILVTAYALIGLSEARDAGFAVESGVISRAQNYLGNHFVTPGLNVEAWRLDRQAFVLYALARSGAPEVGRTVALYDSRDRLSLYARSLLALTLDIIGDNEARLDTLLSDIRNDAITSATGIHWEEAGRDFWNWNTDTRTTAITLGALVRLNPESELIPNVVRWLMVARSADAWETTQETAWAVMALTDWMLASGELDADYDYTVLFNDEELGSGQARPETITERQTLTVEVADMLADEINRLRLERTDGAGNLYYTAHLRAYLPVPEIEPLNRGLVVERRYTLLGDEDQAPITEARIGQVVQVRLTIIAPNDLHYVVVEDPIPAGAEAIDPGLVTAQQIGTRPGLDVSDPVSRGWGWWWFSNIEFRDEKAVLSSTYLPAGTYEYVYTIRPGLEGTFNVIPTTGREAYFPEVYGRGAGSTFTVLAAEQPE
jgi:alpha-2-macroglobulin